MSPVLCVLLVCSVLEIVCAALARPLLPPFLTERGSPPNTERDTHTELAARWLQPGTPLIYQLEIYSVHSHLAVFLVSTYLSTQTVQF